VLREVADFLDRVEAGTGCRPLIYATQEFHAAHLANRWRGHDLWMRNVFRRPVLEPGRRWRYWQFANRGRLEGIEGSVDLDVFAGGTREFDAQLCR
jgi:lysozyme